MVVRLPGASMTARSTTNAQLAALLPDSTIDVRYLKVVWRQQRQEELRLTLTKAGSAGA